MIHVDEKKLENNKKKKKKKKRKHGMTKRQCGIWQAMSAIVCIINPLVLDEWHYIENSWRPAAK